MTTTSLPGTIRATLHRWRMRRATRLALGQLSSYQLKDIGLIRIGDEFLSTNPDRTAPLVVTPVRHGGNSDGAFAWFARNSAMSRRRAVAALAVAAIGFLVLASGMAQAAANTGSNWPSRSCGCSNGSGKCYIQHKNDGESNCLPDGSAGKACSGSCVFTNHPADGNGGGITRSQGTPKSPGGVLAK